MSDRAIPNQVLLDFSNRKLLSPVPKKLYESAKVYFSKKELDLLQTAYNVAFEAHKDQFRKEGSAYITHPVAVASILIELNLDIETVCAGLMHDVLEDSFIKKSYLEKLFGKDVVAIVDGVSNLNKLDFDSIEDRNANNLQKMALAMSKDIRVIIVKLCDRLHNMRTIEFLPREKQIRKSIETIDLYGPIAIRIGMQNIRIELEDLAFKCIHPMRARMLESAIKQAVGGRQRIISKLRKQFKYHLKNNDILATVQGRQKSLYSIYRKIKHKKKPFSEILDVYAFRVIVNSVDDAYRSLGIIHNVHKPVGKKFEMVISIDVLEHIPIEDLGWVLDEIFEFSEKIIFINVACYLAERSFADGSNVHVSIFHPMWWYGFVTKIALNHNKKCFLVCSTFENKKFEFINFAINDDFKNYTI